MQQQVVLITGCSTGIGRATATRLARAGYQVVATARKPETLVDLPVALRLALDVEQSDSVNEAVAQATAAFGRIDALVNNAGYGQIGALEEVSEEHLHRVFEVNVHGAMRLVRAVVPHMRRQGAGRIINLSSVAGRIAIPMMGAYCGTKFALEAMSDALRGELAPFGVRVVLVEPGAIRTEFENTVKAQSGQIWSKADSPYTRAYQAFQHMLAGQNSRAPGPDAVAQVIEHALRVGAPRARYQVPLSAAFLTRAAALTPTSVFDWAAQKLLRMR